MSSNLNEAIEAMASCQYIAVTDLLPKSWQPEIFEILSGDAPFSWGDNNRTLISIERFRDHIEDCFDAFIAIDDDPELVGPLRDEYNAFIDLLGILPHWLYVDMEN